MRHSFRGFIFDLHAKATSMFTAVNKYSVPDPVMDARRLGLRPYCSQVKRLLSSQPQRFPLLQSVCPRNDKTVMNDLGRTMWERSYRASSHHFRLCAVWIGFLESVQVGVWGLLASQFSVSFLKLDQSVTNSENQKHIVFVPSKLIAVHPTLFTNWETLHQYPRKANSLSSSVG